MTAHVEGETLSAYLDGEMGGPDAASVETHLTGCPACRRALVALRTSKALLSAAPRHAMPAAVYAAVQARVRRPVWGRRLLGFFRLPRVWVPAAALAAALLSFAYWREAKQEDYIPLEALSAAHARYTAESLAPQGGTSASDFSAQLAVYRYDD
jgi:anti-sigma factor RsiW